MMRAGFAQGAAMPIKKIAAIVLITAIVAVGPKA